MRGAVEARQRRKYVTLGSPNGRCVALLSSLSFKSVAAAMNKKSRLSFFEPATRAGAVWLAWAGWIGAASIVLWGGARAAHAVSSPAAPRLIVAVSVDQFSADLFGEYRGVFSRGLKRLQEGAVFPNGFQSHAATETCPGHSTLLTGSHPARTGIIANTWIDQSVRRAEKKVYCAEDPARAGSSEHYVASAQFLKAQTLGDRLKAAHPRSRVVAVAGKDRAALMMGGHTIDQVWFWGDHSFITLEDRRGEPAAVARVNHDVAARLARAERPLTPEVCRTHAASVRAGKKEVGVLMERKANDVNAFPSTPGFDHAVADLAIGLLQELKLGGGPEPDVLAIGLSATDYTGHAFGTEGAEMCTQVLAVDAEVERILTALDASRVPYVVVLTADHGGHDLPERNVQHAIGDAARVDAALLPANVSRALAAEFNLAEPVLFGIAPFGDLYLRRDIPQALRARVLEAARARYAAHPQVAAVFTADEIARIPLPLAPADEWSLAERFRAGFDAARSGDLLVALKPHVTPISEAGDGYVATHGSPWNYDRRVPILFYLPGMRGFEQPLPVETVDILPTLAPLVALVVPREEIDGRCLDLNPSAASTCVKQPP